MLVSFPRLSVVHQLAARVTHLQMSMPEAETVYFPQGAPFGKPVAVESRTHPDETISQLLGVIPGFPLERDQTSTPDLICF